MGGGEVLKKGFLIKSPPLEGSGIKSWRKRWFCLLSSKVLEYYKHEHGDLKGVVNLEDCKAVNSDLFHKKYKYVFNVETKERVYYLVASSHDEMREWVEAICRVCRFTSHLPPEGITQSGSCTLPPIRTSLPPPTGVAFTDKFHPSENGGGPSDLYSLAQAAEHEVYQKLYQDPRVPSGVPLSEALASKGIGSGQRTSSSSSQSSGLTSGGDTRSSRSSDYSSETGYFAPRSGDNTSSSYIGAAGLDPRAIYALPQGKGRLAPHPVPKPRAHTVAPAPTASLVPAPTASQSPTGLDQRSASGVGFTTSGAEVMSNGYMKPRRAAERHPNYDYPPLGPPRPAGTPTGTSGNTSPRQHRSALLKPAGDSGVPSSPSSSSSSSSPSHTPPKDPHTYINMRALVDDLPPPINRRNKPQQPTAPPRIDRALKPRSELGYSPPQASSQRDSASEPVVGSYSEDVFTESDIPLRTKRSLHYTQVEFDPVTRRPVPVPRVQAAKPPRRVNYTDVDLKATEERAARVDGQRQAVVSLGQAEMEALASKQYVNLDEQGRVDDDTNPGYYTYMRNFTFEEADKPDYLQFFREQKLEGDREGEEEEELYNDPRDT